MNDITQKIISFK